MFHRRHESKSRRFRNLVFPGLRISSPGLGFACKWGAGQGAEHRAMGQEGTILDSPFSSLSRVINHLQVCV